MIKPLTVEQRLRRAERALRVILAWAAHESKDAMNSYARITLKQIADKAAQGLGRDYLRVKK